MGVSVSKNVSNSIAEVTKEVTSRGQNDMEVYNYITQEVDFTNCKFGGDVDVTQVASNLIKAVQTQRALQNSDLSTEIQQKVIQQAQSSNGWLSLGFASATNVSGQVASSSTKVSQVISDSATSVTTTTQKFKCDGSEIRGNFSLNQYAKNDFFGSQVIDSTQVTQIRDSVDQTTSQTAIAQNAGIFSGLAFLVVIVIGICLLKFLKPPKKINTPNVEKVDALTEEWRDLRKRLNRVNVLFVVIAAVFGLIMIIMYSLNAGPWYRPLYVTRNISSKRFGCDPNLSISDDDPKETKLSLEFPPFRYMMSITGKNALSPLPSLLTMAIYKASLSTTGYSINGGYNKALYLATTSEVLSWASDTRRDTSETEGALPPLLTVPTMKGSTLGVLIPVNFLNNDHLCGHFQCGAMRLCDPETEYNVCGYQWYKTGDDGKGNIETAPQDTPDTQVLAVPNEDAWYKYLIGSDVISDREHISTLRCKYARFKLSEYLEFPCDFYTNADTDHVSFYDELGEHVTDKVSNLQDEYALNMYKVIPTNTWDENDGNGMSGPVVVSGSFSRCMDVHSKAKDKAGLIIGLVVLFIALMFLSFYIPNRIGLNKSSKKRDKHDKMEKSP